MSMFDKCKLRRNGSRSLVHTRADFDMVVKAHNMLADYCKELEKRVDELEKNARGDAE